MLDVLLVDDEPSIRLSVGHMLRKAGHRVTVASDGGEALECIEGHVYDLVISDIRLPRVDGRTLLAHLRRDAPQTDVILITAFGSIADGVQALKSGATDYLTKPFDTEELRIRVETISQHRMLKRELSDARERLAHHGAGPSIIGQSPAMVRLLERVEMLAPADSPVLITGESGTGKELVARRLHALSLRRDRPFVAVNCAAFPETLIEAELFGHERGAFTGAMRRRDGRFVAAHGGTLLLDEVAEIPLPAQAKLLRVLQDGILEPLGTNVSVEVDVRLVSATHRDLKQWVAEGRFREDLYYRINVLDIALPPLRERRGDLPVLVQHFLRSRLREGADAPGFTARAWAALAAYGFPGNVRELEHAIEHAVVLSRGGEIDLHHLPSDIAGLATMPGAIHAESTDEPVSLALAMKAFERTQVLQALARARGRKTRAAELLGISRKNLWEKLRAHGIHDDDIPV